MPSSALTITRTIATRRAAIAELRKQHVGLIDELVASPESEAVPRKMASIEAQIAQATASVQALEAAAEIAATRDAAEALAEARKNTEQLRLDTIAAAAAREKLAAAADAAGAAFVQAVRDLRTTGDAIAADAAAVLTARHPDLAARMNHHGNSVPHAAGTSTAFAWAFIEYVRQAMVELGSNETENYMQLTRFMDTRGSSFVKANAGAVRALEARL